MTPERKKKINWTLLKLKTLLWDFPGGPAVKNLPINRGDMGSIPGLGRFHRPQGN